MSKRCKHIESGEAKDGIGNGLCWACAAIASGNSHFAKTNWDEVWRVVRELRAKRVIAAEAGCDAPLK